MIPLPSLLSLLVASLSVFSCSAKLPWSDTKYMMVFGDSYTAEGYNVSAGVDSPTPGWTSSNGPNWVGHLRATYNVANTKVFNLAYGGATIDSKLVTPYLPTVQSIVDQVSLFKKFIAPKPASASWSSDNTLFAFWIGINDVGNSFYWTNVTQAQFHSTLMERLDTQLEELYSTGARAFLFLTVPPTDRSPLIIQQGSNAALSIKTAIADYNQQLGALAFRFQARHQDLRQVTVFDTQPIFTTLLDDAKTFGYVNVTGWCEAYQNGTPQMATQVAPCAPVSNYFWLNSLHPLFTVHNQLALSISTTLST